MRKNFKMVCLFCLPTWILLAGIPLTDVFASQPGTPCASAEDVTSVQEAVDYIWVLLCAALVFLMQAGFMCLESGLSRAKNSINIAIKNLADFLISVTGFWFSGFAIMFGVTQFNMFGASDFLISTSDPWRSVFFVFQVVFVGTAATIDAGAICGRTKFSAYLIISFVISAFIYPVFGHWAWGSLLHGGDGGWLEKYLHFKDFAGSTVVHSLGAWVAVASLILVGPRIGRYNKDGSVNSIPPHNLTMAYLGAFILFFGWFGFNCGSTLSAGADIAGIAINTVLSAVFGAVSSSVLSWTRSKYKRPEGEMIINGLLGGLVGITAGCAFVDTWAAAVIGLVSGVVVYYGTDWMTSVFKLDDVVGAVPVHGFCGAWGTIALGIFILPEHLDGISRSAQLFGQVAGVVVCFIWTFGVSYIILKVVDQVVGLRVCEQDEKIGLNVAEHGAKSTLLELAESIAIATQNNDFSEARNVEVEMHTEIGDLAVGFNRMLEVVRQSLEEGRLQKEAAQMHAELNKKAMHRAEKERAKAQKLMEKSIESEARLKDLLQGLEASKNKIEEQKNRIHTAADQAQTVSEQTELKISGISESSAMLKQSLKELQNSSQDINEIIETIEKISDQTGLLALNAKIEASRAGNSGKGFKVIAGEIGDLSKESKQASSEVKETLGQIVSELKKLMQKASYQSQIVDQGKQSFQDLNQIIVSLTD